MDRGLEGALAVPDKLNRGNRVLVSRSLTEVEVRDGYGRRGVCGIERASVSYDFCGVSSVLKAFL